LQNKDETLTGLTAPQCLMLQVVLKAKLTLSHLGQIQSPSDKPSGPAQTMQHGSFFYISFFLLNVLRQLRCNVNDSTAKVHINAEYNTYTLILSVAWVCQMIDNCKIWANLIVNFD